MQPLALGGLNILLLAIGLWMGWEALRFGLRWADRVAVRADEAGLVFHWTLLRRRAVGWAELRDAGVRASRRGGATVREAVFVTAARTIVARPVDAAEAEAFTRAVRQRLGAP